MVIIVISKEIITHTGTGHNIQAFCCRLSVSQTDTELAAVINGHTIFDGIPASQTQNIAQGLGMELNGWNKYIPILHNGICQVMRFKPDFRLGFCGKRGFDTGNTDICNTRDKTITHISCFSIKPFHRGTGSL